MHAKAVDSQAIWCLHTQLKEMVTATSCNPFKPQTPAITSLRRRLQLHHGSIVKAELHGGAVKSLLWCQLHR